MKKKILLIGLAIVVLVGGVFYLTAFKDENNDNNEDIASENSISNNVGENVEEEEEVIEEEKESEAAVPDIAIGELAPDFTLLDLNGEEVSLSDFRGKYVLINFWATWCKYCDLEMPDLDRLYEENEDLVVLAVNVMEEKDLVDKYIEEGGYKFPVVLDKEGKVAVTYLVSAFPTSYFVDKEGVLLGGVPGMMTYDQMNQLLNGIRGNE